MNKPLLVFAVVILKSYKFDGTGRGIRTRGEGPGWERGEPYALEIKTIEVWVLVCEGRYLSRKRLGILAYLYTQSGTDNPPNAAYRDMQSM
jgi:hypothetical protein